MKLMTITIAVCAAATAWAADAAHAGAKIFIQPQANGMESYVAAAIYKKHVPVTVTNTEADAQFVLTGSVQENKESTGGKIARCAFLHCIGINGDQIATMRLVDTKTQDVLWAYTVKKGGSANFQSTAEAVAKHLKHYLEQH
jgi:hypothetical protein